MSDPKISLVVYDGSFRQRFFQVDSLEEQTLSKDKFEYIWIENFNQVNQGLKDKLSNTNLNYRTFALDREKSYHLGKCVNKGVKQSKGDIIIVADADTFLEPDVLEKTLEYHQKNDDSVLYIYRYDEPKPPLLRRQEVSLGKLRARCELLNKSNFGGFMSISKDNYLKARGYDEGPIWSGYNSAGALELKTRYENLGLDWKWSDDLKIYHICHENAFGSNRWNGFRVESQWRIIDHRRENDIIYPSQGISRTLSGIRTGITFGDGKPKGEWWEDWLSEFDDKSVGYTPND